MFCCILFQLTAGGQVGLNGPNVRRSVKETSGVIVPAPTRRLSTGEVLAMETMSREQPAFVQVRINALRWL